MSRSVILFPWLDLFSHNVSTMLFETLLSKYVVFNSQQNLVPVGGFSIDCDLVWNFILFLLSLL